MTAPIIVVHDPLDDEEEARKKRHLLDALPFERRMNLEFQGVSAYVSSSLHQPSLASTASSWLCHRGQTSIVPQKQVLHSVTGVVQPGEVFAMMGPSGSGKTTLMNVIGGRHPKSMRTEGRVTVNGQRFTKAMKRRIGFVLQDDLLYEDLTVAETLSYAAKLRLPAGAPASEKVARVEGVVTALGLAKCRDTIIGGYMRRGISGGERKRVSIGVELLTDPSILLLDEPTSGLDSTSALHLVMALQQLASGGRTVCTTIHQPSSRLYRQLDRLMLLAEGRCLFYGPAHLAAAWFAHLGYPLPYGVNVADHLLDLAAGEVGSAEPASFNGGGGGAAGSSSSSSGSPRHPRPVGDGADGAPVDAVASAVAAGAHGAAGVLALARTYSAYAASHPTPGFQCEADLRGVRLATGTPGGVDAGGGGKAAATSTPLDVAVGDGAAPPSRSPSFARGVSRALSRTASTRREGGGGGGADAGGVVAWSVRLFGASDRGGASYSTQLSVLLSRSVKVRRFDSLSTQRVLQLCGVGVVTGLLWFQRGAVDTLSADLDVTGLLFFELLFPAFASMFSALFTFPADYRMMLKERSSGMYRVSAYYLARTASDLPMDCLLPSLFVVLVYFMGGLRLSAGAFLANWGAIMLCVLTAQSIGLLLGAVFMNPKTAQTVSTILMLTFMLVGGYYVRGIPVWIAWVKYLSFLYWGYNLLVKVEFSGHTTVVCTGNAALDLGGASPAPPAAAPAAGGCVPVRNLQLALGLAVDPDDSPALDALVLLVMLLSMRLAVYITLRFKTKPK